MPSRQLLHIFPTFATGGVQLRMAGVMERLGPQYRHMILSLDGDCSAGSRLPQDRSVSFLSGYESLKGLRSVPAMRRAILALSPDLVSTYNWGAMDWALAASFTSIPHLHFESGFGPEEAAGPLRRRSLMRRLALRKTRHLVVPSVTLGQLATAEKWVAADHMSVIPNGVDLKHIRPADKAPDSAPVVLALAPLRAEKRLDRLIALFSDVHLNTPGAKLVIAGDGPYRAALEADCMRYGLGDHVIFKGHLNDIEQALAEADIFAMTSETEQMPNALLQAMAAGLPVVAFSAGDIAHMLPHPQKSFVVPQGDNEGFRHGLTRLLEDAPLRYRLGRANRSHVEKTYDVVRMIAAYDRLYRDALGEEN